MLFTNKSPIHNHANKRCVTSYMIFYPHINNSLVFYHGTEIKHLI